MLGLATKSNDIGRREKLDLDCRRAFRLRRDMDEDRRELIASLATRIGMIMEDSCDEALSLGGMDDEKRVEAIENLEVAIARMAALLAAAKALLA